MMPTLSSTVRPLRTKLASSNEGIMKTLGFQCSLRLTSWSNQWQVGSPQVSSICHLWRPRRNTDSCLGGHSVHLCLWGTCRDRCSLGHRRHTCRRAGCWLHTTHRARHSLHSPCWWHSRSRGHLGERTPAPEAPFNVECGHFVCHFRRQVEDPWSGALHTCLLAPLLQLGSFWVDSSYTSFF